MTPEKYQTTHTGKTLNLENIQSSDINIIDIAVSLSRIRRYGGHVNMSVLRHSLLVAAHFTHNSSAYRYALLHDASEAYLCDIPTYLKKYIKDEYFTLQSKIQRLVSEKYSITQNANIAKAVKEVDQMVCVFEMNLAHELEEPDLEVKSGVCHPYDASVPNESQKGMGVKFSIRDVFKMPEMEVMMWFFSGVLYLDSDTRL